MKNCTRIVALVAGLACSSFALAQETKAPQTDKPTKVIQPSTTTTTTTTTKTAQPAGNDMMAQWEAANKPGKEHVEFAINVVGNWTTTTNMWMAPNTEPMASTGTAKVRSEMGGRIFRQETTGEMAGQKFNGEGWYTYNTASKKYESTWIDSSTCAILYFTGEKNTAGEIIWGCDYTCPMTKQKKHSKAITKIESDKKHTFTMFDTTSDGTEFKALEVTYVRAENETPAKTTIEPKTTTPKSTTVKGN